MSAYCGKCGKELPMIGDLAYDVGHFCNKQLPGGRRIVINVNPDGDYTVSEDDRYADRLCFDEMIGQVIRLTHPSIPKSSGYAMLTYAQQLQRYPWMKNDE